MEQLTLTIIDPIGVHAKVAASIVNIASQYESEIYLHYNNETGNMKSILNILALGIITNHEVKITISGSDESAAFTGIYNFLTNSKIAK